MFQKILQSIIWKAKQQQQQQQQKTEIKESAKFFSVDYTSINTNNVLDIHKYLTKELL